MSDDEKNLPPPPADRPLIQLTRERVLCLRHGEPFREGWPEGFPTFSHRAWLALNPFALAQGDTLENQIKWVEFRLDEMPLCCRLSREQLLPLYAGAKKWKTRFCKNCGDLKPGAAMRARDEKGQPVIYKHVCFYCFLWRVAPHSRASEEEHERYRHEVRLDDEKPPGNLPR